MNIVLILIERLHSADRARTEFAGHDVVGRLARRLVELAERVVEPCDGAIHVALALSQEELAAWTASSREAVAKAMRLLHELGWVQTCRRRVVIQPDRRAAAASTTCGRRSSWLVVRAPWGSSDARSSCAARVPAG